MDGILNTNGEETVTSLTATGTINGEGTVSALTYDLTGATVNANLGTGALTSNGETALNGNAAADIVTVASGTLTVDGALTNNTASINVEAGTLAADGTIAAASIAVDNGATLTTGEAERLNDGVALNADGTVSLGGDETIGDLSGAATGVIANNGNNLTVNQTSDQGFSGNLTGSGGLAKQGEANLTLGNGSDFTGAANVQDGTLTISGALATNTINVANGATLTTTSADLLSDSATLTADGTVNLGGNETIANLLGADTGEVNIGTNNLLLTGGVDFQGRINGVGGSVDAGPGDLILGGENTFTGLLNVLAGSTTNLDGSVDGDVTVNAGGELTLGSAERIADGSALNVDGILNTNGEETVTSLNATGTINGEGTVSALTYDLNGTTVNANLGTGALTSTGETDLNGSAGADTVTVADGTLTVDGALNNNTATVNVVAGTLAANGTVAAASINVDNGATLTTGEAERLNDGVTLNANGSVFLGGDETIGDLSGAATATIANNGNDLTVNQTSDQGFSGNITGPGGLAKQGEANLTLGNGSDFTGAANVNEGTLTISGALATDTINVANGATLTTTAADLLSNGATLTADGTVNLGGNETIANLLGADTGEVNIGANNLLLTGGVDFQGRINGVGGSVDAGPGDLILGGENTFTGLLNVLADSTTTLDGSVDGDVTVEAGGELTLGSVERIADSAALAVAGILNTNGEETVTSLTATGTLNGEGTISALTYDLNGATVKANLGTGALTSTGETDLNGNANADTVTVASGTLTVDGALTNNTASINVEAGTLAANGTIAASNINVQSGATLTTGEAERLNDGVALNADGTVSLGGDETIGDLSGAATGVIDNNGNQLTVNQTSDQGFSGNLTGSGGLAKQGEANLTLGNGSDFTGAANVQDGTLTISGALATNTINVANGATLTTTAAELLNDSATLTADGTINLGGNETITNLLGADTGEVNLGTSNLLLTGGVDFQGRINGVGGSVSMRVRATLSSGAQNTFTGLLNVLDRKHHHPRLDQSTATWTSMPTVNSSSDRPSALRTDRP